MRAANHRLSTCEPHACVQTLVDERQSVGMNSKLLDTLLATKGRMHSTISPIGLKQAATSACIHTFATTGVLKAAPADSDAAAAAPIHLHAADIAGLELPPLAYGGADIVVLARHGGLPAMAAPGMDYVLYPETDGSMCAPPNMCRNVRQNSVIQQCGEGWFSCLQIRLQLPLHS